MHVAACMWLQVYFVAVRVQQTLNACSHQSVLLVTVILYFCVLNVEKFPKIYISNSVILYVSNPPTLLPGMYVISLHCIPANHTGFSGKIPENSHPSRYTGEFIKSTGFSKNRMYSHKPRSYTFLCSCGDSDLVGQVMWK